MTVDHQAAESDIITLDRRRNDRRRDDSPTLDDGSAGPRRRRKQRRRHIDPTTCERDYSEQELEFMRAMDEYKHSSGRMFPTCSEVLEVVRSLGYVQLSDDQIAALQTVEFAGDDQPAAEYEGEPSLEDEESLED